MLHMLKNPEFIASNYNIIRRIILGMPMEERLSMICTLVLETLQDDFIEDSNSITDERFLRTLHFAELPSHLKIAFKNIQFIEKSGSGAAANLWKCRWLHFKHVVKIF